MTLFFSMVRRFGGCVVVFAVVLRFWCSGFQWWCWVPVWGGFVVEVVVGSDELIVAIGFLDLDFDARVWLGLMADGGSNSFERSLIRARIQILQSSDRVENRLDPAGEVVSDEAEVSERFEFSEGVKLQLARRVRDLRGR
ncbi:hypothetical protein CMV_015578 [Castanea mollissima]|uniref:Uncharacterized protein n=1 Tax=Castanea mollissima TaxID=60419 RepID=A0A8J4QVB3_9ROSI|nr:hypothetical protein CMV_015578 [Castanea mollissima]